MMRSRGGKYYSHTGHSQGRADGFHGSFHGEGVNNRMGHFENRLHAVSNNNRNQVAKTGPKCWNCGFHGHISRFCQMVRSKKGNFVFNNRGSCEQYEDVAGKIRYFESDNVALILNSCNKTSCNEWFIDSAASSHMTYDRDILMDFISYAKPSKIFLGDNTTIFAVGEGKVRLCTYDNTENINLALNKVLFVPKLAKNLLSVNAITKMGAEVTFDNEKCVIVKNNQKITIGHVFNGRLYRVNTPEFASFTDSSSSTATLELWHLRLGHLNKDYVNQLSQKNLVVGMECDLKNNQATKCQACVLGKMHKNPFPKQTQHRANRVLERIHTDVCGPMQVDSIGGSRYIVTFTDDYSRYCTVFFLKEKSEVLAKFKQFVNQNENRTGSKVKHLSIWFENKHVTSLRSDNGGEYKSNEFEKYCCERGIFREFTNPYTPQQNGVSERLNRTIIDAVRSMMFHAKLPLKFWAEAVNSAVYLRNRSPTVSLENKTSYECWFGTKPDISNLRVFGCLAFVHVPDNLRQKLDPKSYKAVFVGYPEGTKGFKLYNIKTGQFVRSRNVIFHEDEFHKFDEGLDRIDKFVVFPEEINYETNSTADTIMHDVEVVSESEPRMLQDVLPVGGREDEVELNRYPVENAVIQKTYEETFMQQVQNLGDKRERRPPSKLIEESNAVEECMLVVPDLISEVDEPKSVKDALNSEHSVKWEEAMESEYDSLIKNDTWELVPPPKGVNVVGSRWVYKVKRNPDGSIDRFKARLVAQGYSQTHGVDYSEVFSPVARFSTIRSLLALANAKDLEIHQMDVKTAFLNGYLDCEVYMAQPEGFVDVKNSDFVCKLNKSIYGLKQSARCWNSTLDEYLKSVSYRKSGADGCVYVKSNKGKQGQIDFVILAVYVDDIIPISNNVAMLNAEKKALCERFEMVDNGEAQYILGIQIKRNRKDKVLFISQPSYLRNMLVRFKMEDCKPVTTPLEPGKHFKFFSDNDKPCNIHIYQQGIGCLTYASIITRPDIAAAVGILSQYMSKPSEDHWIGMKRLLRYVKGTLNFGLKFSAGDGLLRGYSDADWAGDVDTRRSTSGFVFRIGDSTVSWRSKKQLTVAKSSTEAEYVALSVASQEAIWIRQLLNDIPINYTTLPTVIFEDNNGAIELSRNDKYHNRTKHIDISYHFIRERVESNEISVKYCPTNDMIADVMTKGLSKLLFQKFRCLLGVTNVD